MCNLKSYGRLRIIWGSFMKAFINISLALREWRKYSQVTLRVMNINPGLHRLV